MHIRSNSAKFSKILKNSQKVKQNICGQTTSKNGQIFTIWPQKGQVPSPALKLKSCEEIFLALSNKNYL